MKNFLTSMLGALVALIIFCGGAFLLFVVFLIGIASLNNEKPAPELASGSYVVFDLSTNITDAPPSVDYGPFGGSSRDTLQLRTATRALHAIAKDDRVAGVFITGDLAAASLGSGFAALKEVRAALAEVKAAGKPVRAYMTYATAKDYYVASVADEIALDPYGMLVMPGLATEPMFFAGAFEKYGIGVQVTRVGKYKSAVEPFTRRDMSPENREEIQKLLDDVWTGVLDDIAPTRKITRADIQKVVDAEGLIRPEAAKSAKLIDRIAYRDEIYEDLKAATGRKGKEAFKQINLVDYAKATKGDTDLASFANVEKPKGGTGGGHGDIAIVYAEGDIVDGEGDTGEVGGSRFSRELRRIRQDDSIKAVVLRVNSPGGSASAAEVIQREVILTKKVKPVIVSMGSYAASGGYWISTYGDRIFAEPTTITGSIGVFGVQFDVKKLANDFGITFDSAKTGKFADAITISRPKTPEELAMFQRMVDWIYGQFIAKVSESRKLPRDKVEEIAQGRVWSGTEAKKLGLVDELGGLDAALAYAAQKVNLGTSARIIEYPRPKELMEAIQDLVQKGVPENAHVRSAGLATQLAQRLESEVKVLREFNDPQGVYARLPMNLSLH